MLFSFGGADANPTFFELDAAEKLQGGLKSALVYTLGVIGSQIKISISNGYFTH